MLFVALLFCLCLSGLVNVYAVVTVPTSTFLSMPSFSSYLNFDAEQNFTSLYRESSANISYPEYWFMTLLSGETFGLQGDANFTVSTVFANQSLVYTQLTFGTVHVYCGSLGEPTSISGAVSSSYDPALNVSSLFSIGSSTVRVSWAAVPPPPPPPDVTLTINQPTTTSYNTSAILTSLSASGGTIDKIWFNVQNSSGSWVYAGSQFYTAPYFMTGFTNGSYVLYAFANNTVGNSDSASVAFSVAIPSVPPVIIEPVLSVIQPFNKTYATGNVPVELSTSGTVDAVWFNVKNGSAWIYTVNQTYTAATSLTGFVNGSYVFYGFTANSEGGFDMATVSFSINILANPLLPQVDVDSYWLFLYEGDFLGFLQAYLISVFLNFETAVALIIFLFLVPIYLRTKSLLLVSILWMMLGGFFVAAVPAAAGIGVLFIALGIGGLLWRLFRPSGYG
ncbi:MAG: hypothetical protein WC325_09430 [Candidatus Bathyarchaeia archaeon]